MNIQKLLARNIKNPLHKRIDSAELQSKLYVARMRGNAVALLASIHAKIDGKIAAKRATYE